jgi:hypothetical protein
VRDCGQEGDAVSEREDWQVVKLKVMEVDVEIDVAIRGCGNEAKVSVEVGDLSLALCGGMVQTVDAETSKGLNW